MPKITVKPIQPRKNGYTIHIGSGLLGKLSSLFDFSGYSRVFIVTDAAVADILLDKLKAALPVEATSLVLASGETEKNIANAQEIWTAMHKAGCDRHALVINLGGGVIGDIGAFAASTYMRGIDFLNIPTTLLSQVDSSVGGKTGVNFDGIKNLVGTFDPPNGVIIDPDLLSTLPNREFVEGFGEIIKHGLIWDERHFEQATAQKPKEFTADKLTDIIVASCRIKLAIVEDDMHEGSSRRLVNFGHTAGHAIEALCLNTDNPLLHGEAVSIGMVAEATISVRLGLLPAADLDRIIQALQHAGLPTSVSGLDTEAIQKKMLSDKKNKDGRLNFTLIDKIGHAAYNKEVPAPVVTEAIQAILN